jgi:prepilin-type N-terminal cleavage/methylation domain-containing protein
MPSRTEAAARNRQKGFSLLEVMVASTILSIFILGIGGFWYQASTRTNDLVLKEKAIFALSGELERISALYVYTSYATDAVNGPLTTTGYDGLASLPTTRLIYAGDISSYASNDYVRNVYGSFNADEFEVYVASNILPALKRDYIWVDKGRSIVGRLSWTATDITSVPSCVQALDCSCQRFDNVASSGGRCKLLDVYLEYPYRINSSGNVTPPASLQTISLRTIVGRG